MSPSRAFALCCVVLSSASACSDAAQQGTPDAARDVAASGGADAAVDAPALVPQTITIFDRVRINSRGDTNVRRADAPMRIARGAYAKATLVVDLETSCFPFTWTPPAGQRWPEDCDAFDRNFELRVDPPADAAAGPPSFEPMRAITPFGGPLHLEIDVTDLANARPGDHTLRVVIPTYSDASGQITGSNGGWWVTVKLDTVPGAPPREVLAAIPLFDHTYKAGDGEQRVDIDVPDGTTKGVIAYRVTGHGGAQPSGDKACIGGADEFCQRRHHLLVDGKEIDAPAPWRNDCATLCTLTPGPFGDYCKENPCGAISSVRASRANWCPGSLTAPLVYEVPALAKPGKHTFAYAIDNVHSGGSWRVSAVYYAYR
ncbi:MAG: hypothetical protein KC503_12380 [Myxococcales bacterium]|nr:hypothetical protein [Myxococcales bacterium]